TGDGRQFGSRIVVPVRRKNSLPRRFEEFALTRWMPKNFCGPVDYPVFRDFAVRPPVWRCDEMRDDTTSPHRLGLDAVPPRAGAGRELKVAVHHLDRPAIAVLGELEAQLAGVGALPGRKPGAFVPPHAGAFLSLMGLPRGGIDAAPTPPVLDHE